MFDNLAGNTYPLAQVFGVGIAEFAKVPAPDDDGE